MKVNGRIIRCMELDTSNGQMAVNIMDLMLMIRKKVVANLFGQMEEATRGIGKMANRMVVEFIKIKKGHKSKELGSTGKKLNGIDS